MDPEGRWGPTRSGRHGAQFLFSAMPYEEVLRSARAWPPADPDVYDAACRQVDMYPIRPTWHPMYPFCVIPDVIPSYLCYSISHAGYYDAIFALAQSAGDAQIRVLARLFEPRLRCLFEPVMFPSLPRDVIFRFLGAALGGDHAYIAALHEALEAPHDPPAESDVTEGLDLVGRETGRAVRLSPVVAACCTCIPRDRAVSEDMPTLALLAHGRLLVPRYAHDSPATLRRAILACASLGAHALTIVGLSAAIAHMREGRG